MVQKKVQKLRTKRQNLRTKRKGAGGDGGGGEESEKATKVRVGRGVATTSYLRAQGKAYASSRTGSAGYKAGEDTKLKNGESKAEEAGGRDKRKSNINKKIKKVSRQIKKARK